METLTARQSAGLETIAALLLSAIHPHTNPNEADSAFHRVRERIVRDRVDPHTVADRVRGRPSFRETEINAPAFLAMPSGVRRIWMDAIALRMPITKWERSFLADVRGQALSSASRLSQAQLRTIQSLVDQAWAKGVRP